MGEEYNSETGLKKEISGEELLREKKLERQKRKGERKRNFFKGLLRFFTSILIIYTVVSVSRMRGWYLPQTAFTKPDGVSVIIVNNRIVKTQKVYSELNKLKVPKVPLYMANFNSLKKTLRSLPPVEDVYIRRYAFPARIFIIIREAAPIITIAPDKNISPIAIFNKNGKLITGSEYLPLNNYNGTVSVLSYGNKGDDYHKWNLAKIHEIEKIAKYVETFSKEPVEYVDMRNPNDIFVKVKSVNIRLGKIDNKIYERIKRIPSIMPELKKVKNSVEYIDVSWEKANFLKLKNKETK